MSAAGQGTRGMAPSPLETYGHEPVCLHMASLKGVHMTDSTTHPRPRTRVSHMPDARCPNCDTELVGRAEIADRLGVNINTVDSWRGPEPKRPTTPPFPTEAFRLGSSNTKYAVPVWDWPTIEAWAKAAGKNRQLPEVTSRRLGDT